MVMPTFSPTNPWTATTEKVMALLDAAIQKRKAEEPKREYLGASMMGKECLRAVAYEFHDVPKDPGREFSGSLLRVFDMGHDAEARMAAYLRLAGFDLRDRNDEGKQFEYTQADGRMQGHVDGVIMAGPDIGCAWPALWENKGLNNDSFNDVVEHGIRKSKPTYYAQAQIYMAYLGLERCLFTCINRNTGDVHIEIIELDIRRAQEVSDNGVRVITSRSPEDLPRIAREETDFRCRFCDWHDTCWGKNTPATPQPAPSWLTKRK